MVGGRKEEQLPFCHRAGMTSVEVMNESRRRKRINKAAQQLASAAAEAAAPSKKIRLTEGEGGVMKVGGSDGDDDSDDDANADIIMSMTKEERAIRAKAAKKASSSHVRDMTEKKTSTTKQKALARLRERQEREANRSVLLEELAKHSISASETAIMKSSSKLGKAKQTKKERLQQALKEERIGIKVTDSTGLVVGMETGGMSARKARKLALEAKERELQSSGGEDDEEEEDEEDEEDEEGRGERDEEDGDDGEEVMGEDAGDQDMEDAGGDRNGASEEEMGRGEGEAEEGGAPEDGKSGGMQKKKSKTDVREEHKHRKTTAKEDGGGRAQARLLCARQEAPEHPGGAIEAADVCRGATGHGGDQVQRRCRAVRRYRVREEHAAAPVSLRGWLRAS